MTTFENKKYIEAQFLSGIISLSGGRRLCFTQKFPPKSWIVEAGLFCREILANNRSSGVDKLPGTQSGNTQEDEDFSPLRRPSRQVGGSEKWGQQVEDNMSPEES